MILDLTRLYVRYLGWTVSETLEQLRFRVLRAMHSWCPCNAWEDV